jgi:PAS domain S-box-containing protein
MKLIFANPKANLNEQAARLYDEHSQRICGLCDRMFAGLFVLQWVGGIICAIVVTPRTWIGETSSIHLHVWAAILFGGVVFSLPIYLIVTRTGSQLTRQTIAVAQMLYAALLIHLTGGRIETHFHIFGSLAFLAFYRDWRVLLTATLVVAADHFLRGVFWSESVFGVAYVSQWRWIEHAGWVIFEDIFLVMACLQGRQEMAEIAWRQADTVEQGNKRSTKLKLALADQHDLLTALDSGAIIDTTDAEGRITSVNDRFCEISGFAREELVGNYHRILNSGHHSQDFWSRMGAVVAAGGVWQGEIRNRKKNGEIWWADTTIKGVLGPDGKLQKMVAVRADITDRKATESHLQQAQKLESIGQLAAGIAHEINTPTQYVGDNIRFLQTQYANLMKVVESYAAQLDTSTPAKPWSERKAEIENALQATDFEFLRAEIPQAIEQSLEGVNRIAAIVRAMKDFSHPGSETKEPADLNRSILSTIEVCRARWKYVAELQTDLAEDLPSVPCLVAEFNQVILNLIVNAADAIAESVGSGGERKGLIRVSTRLVEDATEIRVQDNGMGIPDAIKARMFEQFFTTKPVGKGTGQGLALSRSVIVNKHGGKLTFESIEGTGTTFIIQLPITGSTLKNLEAA